MPEKEITVEQGGAVRRWINDVKKGGVFAPLMPDVRGSGVYKVDGEPLALWGQTNQRAYIGEFRGSQPTRYILLCNDRHAQELQEAGVIDFNEVDARAS